MNSLTSFYSYNNDFTLDKVIGDSSYGRLSTEQAFIFLEKGGKANSHSFMDKSTKEFSEECDSECEWGDSDVSFGIFKPKEDSDQEEENDLKGMAVPENNQEVQNEPSALIQNEIKATDEQLPKKAEDMNAEVFMKIEEISKPEKKFLSQKRVGPETAFSGDKTNQSQRNSEITMDKGSPKNEKCTLKMETYCTKYMSKKIISHLPEKKGKTFITKLQNFFKYTIKLSKTEKKKEKLKLSLIDLINHFISNKNEYPKNEFYDSTCEFLNYIKECYKINQKLKKFLDKKIFQIIYEFSLDENEREKMKKDEDFIQKNADFKKIGSKEYEMIDLNKKEIPGYLRFFLQEQFIRENLKDLISQ